MASTNLRRRFGPYRIDAELGAGSFGTVYRAVQEDLGRPVALKVLHGTHRDDPHIRARFTKEMRVMIEVSHPALVKLLDAGEIEGCPYIASELVIGTDLRNLVIDMGPLPEPAVHRMGVELCSALEYLESKRMMHRDIKPSNAMHRDDGSTILLDLGLAKAVGDENLTRTGRLVGNFQFMAPEVFQTTEHTHRSDLYALAGVMYFVLTGQPPLTNDEVSLIARGGIPGASRRREVLQSSASPGLARILDAALEVDPGRRLASAAAMRGRLEELVPKPPPTLSLPERPPDRPRTTVPTPRAERVEPTRISWKLAILPVLLVPLLGLFFRDPPPSPPPPASPAPSVAPDLLGEIRNELVEEKHVPVELHRSETSGLHVDTVAIGAVESIRGLTLRTAEGWPAKFRVAIDGHWKEVQGREASLDPALLRPGVQILEVETGGDPAPLRATLFLERGDVRLPAPGWPPLRAMTATEKDELAAADRVYVARQGSAALEELARKYPEVAEIQDRAGQAIMHTRLGMQALAGERLDPATGAREGLNCYQQALRANPRRSLTWVSLAQTLRDYREFELSRRVLAVALILEPGHPQAWKHLGLLLHEHLQDDGTMTPTRRRRLASQGARGFVLAREKGAELNDAALLDEADLWLESGDPARARARLAPRLAELGSLARTRELLRRLDSPEP